MQAPAEALRFEEDLWNDVHGSLRIQETLSNAERLPLLKGFLERWDSRLKVLHESGLDSREVCRLRAVAMDGLTRALFAVTLARAGLDGGHGDVAMVATGGYGRSELCPYSDVDLMLLFADGMPPERLATLQTAFTDWMLYPLWDLNLKVGHSMRTVTQALEEGRADAFTKTALLTTRCVDGDPAVFEALTRAYAAWCAQDPLGFLRERLDGVYERRKRFGETVFLQEPEIKNGVGGLRDFQNVLWIGQVVLDATGIDELARKGWLREIDAENFVKAHAFLLRVRNEVHFESARANDLLNLERQPSVASAFGYTQADPFRRVEAFMREYYGAAQTIYRVCRFMEQRLESTFFPRAQDADGAVRAHGFVVTGGYVFAEREGVFAEDPIRFVQAFRLAQKHRAKFDYSLEVLVRENIHRLTPPVALSAPLQAGFREILQDAGNVAPTLRRMHALGALVRILPEFAPLFCLVQHEQYHRYTADIHSIATVEQLDKIFLNEGPHAAVYAPVLKALPEPWVLYPALLLHGVGKIDGGDAGDSVRIAEGVLERLGASPQARELVLFTIRAHLEMTRVCRRYDIDDPRTANVFARVMGDAQKLRAVFIHTYCDANGTSATLWNNYKQRLHQQLFEATLLRLEGPPNAANRALSHAKKRLLEALAPTREKDGLTEDEISAHFNLMPEGYFLNAAPATVRRHLRMAHTLFKRLNAGRSPAQSLVPVMYWSHNDAHGLSTLDVVTWDRPGLFYRLAGALAAAGIHILNTRAISRPDDITIDTFTVRQAHSGAVKSPFIRTRFEKLVKETLRDSRDLLPNIEAQAQKLSRMFFENEKPVRARIDAQVQVYRQAALAQNVVEVLAKDRLGLLYKTAKAISLAGFDITFARIAVERGVANETFYVRPTPPENDESPEALDRLRQQVQAAIEG